MDASMYSREHKDLQLFIVSVFSSFYYEAQMGDNCCV